MIFDEETTKSIFEQYLGQDVWIKCEGKYNHHVVFVRPHSINSNGWGDFRVSGDYVSTDEISHFTYRPGWLDISVGTGWAVVDPLEVYTTAELFDLNFDYNQKVFDKFKGTSYWFLITAPEYSRRGNYYVQCTFDSVGRISAVPENQVTNFSLETADTYVPPENSPSMFKISLDNIKVSDPLEVLSDEELREMLEQNQQLWEEWFGDEGEDY